MSFFTNDDKKLKNQINGINANSVGNHLQSNSKEKAMALLNKIFIKELQLNNRLANVLSNLKINTLSDLIKTSLKKICNARNFGYKSYRELKELLLKYNISIPVVFRRDNKCSIESLTDFNNVLVAINPEEVIVAENSKAIVDDETKTDTAITDSIEDSKEKAMSILNNIHIDSLLLSNRLSHILFNLNIRTAADLVQFPKSQIYSAKGFGNKTYRELKECLLKFNIKILNYPMRKGKECVGDDGLDGKIGRICGIIDENKLHELGRIRIADLQLSNRLTHVLLKLNIYTMGDLVGFSKEEIFNAKNFGKKSLRELKNLLSEYNLFIYDDCEGKNMERPINWNHVLLALNGYENDIKNQEERVNSNLYLLIENIRCDKEIKQLCYSKHIYKIGQLTEYNIEEFFSSNNQIQFIENFNNKYACFIDELLKIGITKWPCKYPSHRNDLYSYNFNEIKKIGLINCFCSVINKFFFYLSDKEKSILLKRWKLNFTLEDIGKDMGLTRERVRQIQKRAEKKILKSHFEKNFQSIVETCFNEYGSVYAYQFSSEIDFVKKVFSELQKEKNGEYNSFYFDDDFELIVKDANWKDKLYDNVRKSLSQSKFFTENYSKLQIHDVIKNNLLNIVNNSTEFQQENYNKILDVVLNDFINKYTISLGNGNYKLLDESKLRKSGGVFIDKRNEEILVKFKNLFPHGVHLPIEKSKEHILEKNLMPLINILPYRLSLRTLSDGIIKSSNEIILWGKGTYIHIDNTHVKMSVVDEIISKIINEFNNGLFRFSINKIYKQNREIIYNAGIPNTDALMGLIKYKSNPRIGNKKNDVFDTENYERDEKKEDMLVEYIKRQDSWVSTEELLKYFCKKLGWHDYQVIQCATNSSEIKKDAKLGYICMQTLKSNLNKERMKELLNIVYNSLRYNVSVSLLDIKNTLFRYRWKEILGYEVTENLMSDFIDSLDLEKLPFIFHQGRAYKKNYESWHALGEYVLDCFFERKYSNIYKEFSINERDFDKLVLSKEKIETVLNGDEFGDINKLMQEINIQQLAEIVFFPFDDIQVRHHFKSFILERTIDKIKSWIASICYKETGDDDNPLRVIFGNIK